MSYSSVATTQERKWKKRVDDLVIELTGLALMTIIGTGIGFLLAQQPIKHLLSDVRVWIFVVITTLLGWGFIHFARKSVVLRRQLMDMQEKGEDQTQSARFTKFNIQQIYSNRLECNDIIQEEIWNSSIIKFFLLIGSEFAEDSGIYLPALREKPAGNAKVQILIAAPDSPFLSEKRINSIRNDKEGHSREKMLAMLNLVEKQLVVLTKQMRQRAFGWSGGDIRRHFYANSICLMTAPFFASIS